MAYAENTTVRKRRTSAEVTAELRAADELVEVALALRGALYSGSRANKLRARLDAACAAWLALSDPKALRSE